MKSSFNHEGIYVCECGQTFTNSQKFNNHKSMCPIHYEAIGKNIEVRNQSHRDACRKAGLRIQEQNAQLKAKKAELDLQQWISEKHTCEKCGKVMTEKYGSGRFCCASCAKTRKHSEETKEKIRQKSKSNSFGFKSQEYIEKRNSLSLSKKLELEKLYLENPPRCIICGSILPFEKLHRKTCSPECLKISKSASGGFKQNSARNYKQGYYQEISCDSSWELAFLVYCIENNIQVERNFESFPYVLNGKQHLYIPDFKINQTYIEVKGYIDDTVSVKAAQMLKNNLKYKLLTYIDLKVCIDYCKQKYGNKFWEVLYDRTKPSCLDKK